MTTITPQAVETLAAEYGEAWNRQDLAAIVASHAPDGTFHLHVPGAERACGRDAIEAAFAGFIAQLTDIRFEQRRLLVGESHWVFESTLTGTAAAAFDVDGETVDAPGAHIEVDFLDVIEVRDGLIASKDSYLDALAFERQLREAR